MTSASLRALVLTYRQQAARARRIVERDAVANYQPEPWLDLGNGATLSKGPDAGELHDATTWPTGMRRLLDIWSTDLDAEVANAIAELLALLVINIEPAHDHKTTDPDAHVAQVLRRHRERRRSIRCHERRLVAARAAADEPAPASQQHRGPTQARSLDPGGMTRPT